ncbi:hypothetical protein [Streptomyces sp. PSAA01]|uniref:hypothetical protein n=1 Tax=Streptomyces sp. PSAA01 TaxID=2912762 RepID=UPI001F2ADB34|nr:hypothetical protein [Streptomyces sp. PSAA01]MCG0289349.1 hypothetical protein [Streptomyces sp. PSAA01]
MPSHLLVLIDLALIEVVHIDVVLVGLCESVWWVWCESVWCGRKPTLPLPGPQAKGTDALLSSGAWGV